MTMQPWAKLVRVTLAATLMASAIGVSGAPLVTAQEEDPCAAIAGGELQIPDIVEGKFNVAMVLIGPHNDGGWSEAHFDGLRYICENIEDSHVAYVENVPEGADSEQVFRSLARKGFDYILGTSFGYMDGMEVVAEEFPNQYFIHISGYKSNGANFGNLFGAMEDFKYLAGMIAGSRAKTDGETKLGYMATFPIPEEVRLGNAIMLGAKETCPECTMDIRWIATWHDPTLEMLGAASLFDAGAHVVFTGADTPAVAQVAEEVGKWAVTYDHPESCTSPACLTAPYWIWGPEYVRIGNAIKDGTYQAGWEYFDAELGSMGLYGFMEGETRPEALADLPEEDIKLVEDTLAAMLAGEFNRFDVFAGPIVDNQGNVIVPEGERMEQSDLDQFPPGAPGLECQYCMQWWADGIEASRLPGS
jgi:basic membrane protein A